MFRLLKGKIFIERCVSKPQLRNTRNKDWFQFLKISFGAKGKNDKFWKDRPFQSKDTGVAQDWRDEASRYP
jgi:hypothetical protein